MYWRDKYFKVGKDTEYNESLAKLKTPSIPTPSLPIQDPQPIQKEKPPEMFSDSQDLVKRKIPAW
jgi:hypothetical protein